MREYDFDAVSREIDDLIAIADTFDDMRIVAKMKEIVPEYISKNSVFSELDGETASAAPENPSALEDNV